MSNTRTMTIRISNNELIRYVAALDNAGYMPSSRGDIVKAICRLWMNENYLPHIKIEQRHINFVLNTDTTNCNVYSKPIEE